MSQITPSITNNHLLSTSRRQSTNNIIQFVGNIHVIQNYPGNSNIATVMGKLFSVHAAQISVIMAWASGNLFHLGWQSNYSYWLCQPTKAIPISHGTWDPHYSSIAYDIYSTGSTDYSTTVTYSGIYHWMYTVGLSSESQIYTLSLGLELAALLLLAISLIHLKLEEGLLATTSTLSRTLGDVVRANTGYRLNYHIGVFIGVSSILWASHIIHIGIPASRGTTDSALHLEPFFKGDWIEYSTRLDGPSHIHFSEVYSGTAILTFTGGLTTTTASLPLTDIAHHHLALGVIAIWISHTYNTIYLSVGHRIKEIFGAYGSTSVTPFKRL